MALQALALRLPVRKSVPHGTCSAKVATDALKAVGRAGRTEGGTADVEAVEADRALRGAGGVALQAVADAGALHAVEAD